MNKKFVFTIAAAVAATVVTAMAGDETEKTLEERVAELEAANKKSNWAENIKIKGDLRYRYEYKATDGDTTHDRHRIRARIGAYGKVADNVSAAIRIASGNDESPTSTNQTLENDFDKKEVWLDLAYITIDCPLNSGLSTTFGKMKQPWVQVSDLIFDSDVNPEGISGAYEFGNDALSLTTTIAYHMLDDKGTGEDDNLTSGQIAAKGSIVEGITLTAGVGAFYYSEQNYEIIDGFVKTDVKNSPLPVHVYGEYLNNTASGVDEDTAWIVGIGTKIKDVKIDYNYRNLEANSVWGALDDGDFGGPDGKGHKIKVKYDLFKNTSVGATYFLVDRNNTDREVLQLDLAVKF